MSPAPIVTSRSPSPSRSAERLRRPARRRRATRPAARRACVGGRLGDHQAADPCERPDRLLAGRVDVEHDDLVGGGERRAELAARAPWCASRGGAGRPRSGAGGASSRSAASERRRPRSGGGRSRRRSRAPVALALAARGGAPSPGSRQRRDQALDRGIDVAVERAAARRARRGVGDVVAARDREADLDARRSPPRRPGTGCRRAVGATSVASRSAAGPGRPAGGCDREAEDPAGAVEGRPAGAPAGRTSAGGRGRERGERLAQLGQRAPVRVVVELDVGDHRDLGVELRGSCRRSRRPRRPPTRPRPSRRWRARRRARRRAARRRGRRRGRRRRRAARGRSSPPSSSCRGCRRRRSAACAGAELGEQLAAVDDALAALARALTSSGLSSGIAVETTTSASAGTLVGVVADRRLDPGGAQPLEVGGLGPVGAASPRRRARCRPAPGRSSRRRRSRRSGAGGARRVALIGAASPARRRGPRRRSARRRRASPARARPRPSRSSRSASASSVGDLGAAGARRSSSASSTITSPRRPSAIQRALASDGRPSRAGRGPGSRAARPRRSRRPSRPRGRRPGRWRRARRRGRARTRAACSGSRRPARPSAASSRVVAAAGDVEDVEADGPRPARRPAKASSAAWLIERAPRLPPKTSRQRRLGTIPNRRRAPAAVGLERSPPAPGGR